MEGKRYTLLSKNGKEIKHVIYIGKTTPFCINPEYTIGYYIRHEFKFQDGEGVMTIPDNDFDYEVLSEEIK
jgi:hypothetical protein